LEGDFSFVVWDPRAQRVFAARDQLGIRPLYYAKSGDRFAWASSASLLNTLDWVDKGVRDDWLARYVARRSMEWQGTAFAGIRKLPPGYCLVVGRDVMEISAYHTFRDDPPWEDVRESHWLEDYSQALAEAVRSRIDPTAPVGAETSGGLDSSTLVGMIAKLSPDAARRMHTFGFVSQDLETQYILETSRQWRIPFNHILTPSQRVEMELERRGWETLGHPAEHTNAVSHIPFHELARTLGVRTLHSGHGGDETVTNPGSKALAELIKHRRWSQALSDVQGPAVVRPLRLASVWRRGRKGEVSQLTAPLMKRLNWSILTRDALQSAEIEQRTREAARYDAPYDTVNEFVLGNRLGPHISTRTAECSIVAASYGVEYQWPLLDRRLVQQYLSTPAVWKYGEGFGRYLHRRAVAEIVPDKVAWKRSKSMQSAGGKDAPPPRASNSEHVLPQRGELHPQLEALVDRDRVNLLTKPGSDSQARTLRDQLHRIAVLNTWLHERNC
jgi:asparagine synthase (glutamine-hydrolysing)